MSFTNLLIFFIVLIIVVAKFSTNESSKSTKIVQSQIVNIDPSTFSTNKKKFVDSMCGTTSNLALENCVCMYDSMNPELSSQFGKNWMSKGTHDLDLWLDELNKAIQHCGLENKL